MRFLTTFLSLVLVPLTIVMPVEADMSPVAGINASTGEASVPGTTSPAAQANVLQIRLADSGKAVVDANSSARGYSVVVTDGSGLPVADVAVAIRLPEEGATGFFTDGAHSAVAYTDASGVAKFTQVNWGSTVGTVAIRVTAAKGELHAGALIEETIVAHSVSAAPAQSSAPAAAVQVAQVAKESAPIPGTPTSVASVHSGAAAERPEIKSTETAASAEPVVSIVNTGSGKGSHGSNKKWILLAAIAASAGAGMAVAMAGKGGSGTTTAPTAGLSIGTPTISVGH